MHCELLFTILIRVKRSSILKAKAPTLPFQKRKGLHLSSPPPPGGKKGRLGTSHCLCMYRNYNALCHQHVCMRLKRVAHQPSSGPGYATRSLGPHHHSIRFYASFHLIIFSRSKVATRGIMSIPELIDKEQSDHACV